MKPLLTATAALAAIIVAPPLIVNAATTHGLASLAVAALIVILATLAVIGLLIEGVDR